MKKHYLSCADTAKLVRAALKKTFPGVAFSVKSKTYSGGASINVSWTDGPTDKMVSAITGQYQGGGFDGSIDMGYSVSHWLRPDGSTFVASNPGTVGSMGSVPAERQWMPEPDCKLVHFGATFVFTRRDMSPAFAERVIAKARAKWGDVRLSVYVSKYDGSASITGDYDDERKAHEIANRFMVVRG